MADTEKTKKVNDILCAIPSKFRGPGGAIAVISDGNLVAQKVWGFADMERRIPMTSDVLMPICSITKQFVSALVYDLSINPPPKMRKDAGTFEEQMIARLRQILPAEFVDNDGLTVDDLISMSSGLRDYWALCTLQGSRPDSPYSIVEHNAEQLRRQKTLHFKPSTEYSYSNVNFNIVERLIEHVAQDSLANLLRDRILSPAGMKTAGMCPRTDRYPAPIVGYEGSEDFGFFPAPNAIEWSADAGMIASLNDMIAYEKYFDRRWRDEKDGYREMVQPRKYKNGAFAKYRYGLGYHEQQGVKVVSHGGALRGFKLHRRYVESARLSIIVLFNHHAKTGDAADYIMKHILGLAEESKSSQIPHKDWFGAFLDKETQLVIRMSKADQGKVNLLYSRFPEALKLVDERHAKSDTTEAWIEGDSLRVFRSDDNRELNAQRLVLQESDRLMAVQGQYYCSET